MLAKTTDAERKLANFRAVLHLPEPSEEYRQAERNYQAAIDAREMVTSEKNAILADIAQAGFTSPFQRTPSRTPADVAAIDIELKPLVAAEAEAKATRDRLRGEYAATAKASLAGATADFHVAVSLKLDELRELLDIGSALHAEALQASIELEQPIISGAAKLNSGLVEMVRKIVASWRR